MPGKFIIVDGIDGSGKGAVVNFFRDFARVEKKKIFDLREYWQTNHRFPKIEELKGYKVILSAEPTFAWVGAAIRREIVRENRRNYSALSTAQAYALDREILYQRVLLPALKKGLWVFQERSFTTSLIYQPIQAENLPLKKVLAITGNALALKNNPDLLIITKLSPKIALQRLAGREKKDKAIFEKLAFLEKAEKRFLSPWFRKIFSRRGTRVVYLDTNKKLAETKKDCEGVWKRLK